jgi:hypothetical protein
MQSASFSKNGKKIKLKKLKFSQFLSITSKISKHKKTAQIFEKSGCFFDIVFIYEA